MARSHSATMILLLSSGTTFWQYTGCSRLEERLEPEPGAVTNGSTLLQRMVDSLCLDVLTERWSAPREQADSFSRDPG